MVEFAIVLPLFMVLTFGIIEFGIIMYNKALITNASREGARFGVLYVDPPPVTSADIEALKLEIETKVKSKLGITDNPTKSRLISLGGSAAPVIVPSLGTDGTENYLEVKVTFFYQFLVLPKLKLGGNLLNPLPIGTTTTMRMEYQP